MPGWNQMLLTVIPVLQLFSKRSRGLKVNCRSVILSRLTPLSLHHRTEKTDLFVPRHHCWRPPLCRAARAAADLQGCARRCQGDVGGRRRQLHSRWQLSLATSEPTELRSGKIGEQGWREGLVTCPWLANHLNCPLVNVSSRLASTDGFLLPAGARVGGRGKHL